jgi:hypothetical protein
MVMVELENKKRGVTNRCYYTHVANVANGKM